MKAAGIFIITFLAVFLCTASLVPSLAAQQDSAKRDEERTVSTSQGYSGNVQTKKYHKFDCRFFSCKDCTVYFSSPTEAQSKGYQACKRCGG